MEVVILAGLLGLVAVGVWTGRAWLPAWASPNVSAVAGVANLSKPDAKPATAPGKRKADKLDRRTIISNFTIGDLPGSRTEVDVPMPGSPFPTRTDLYLGATGVQIRAKYGEPTARVTAMQGGRLVERYYYLNNDRTQLTVATLEHGVIVSVESP
jgi:hypothetical protein